KAGDRRVVGRLMRTRGCIRILTTATAGPGGGAGPELAGAAAVVGVEHGVHDGRGAARALARARTIAAAEQLIDDGLDERLLHVLGVGAREGLFAVAGLQAQW